MIIYYINLIFTTILNFFSRKFKENNKYTSICLGAIAIIMASLVCGLRYGVGTDFFEYQNWFFRYIDAMPSANTSDIGFAIFIKILQIFSKNPQIMYIAVAFFVNIMVMIFIKRNTKWYDMGYFLFIALSLYYSSFNIMRQWIAISMFLYALKYAFDGKFIKYSIVILVASTFHATAILLLPVYFLFKLKLNRRNTIILMVSLFIILFSFEPIINFIANLTGIDATRYLRYFKQDGNSAGGYAYFIFACATYILYLLVNKNYIANIKNGEQHIKLLMVTILVCLVGAGSSIFTRLQLYFVPILLICIPNCISFINKRQRKVIVICIYLVGMIYMYRSLKLNGGDPLPYISIFNIF